MAVVRHRRMTDGMVEGEVFGGQEVTPVCGSDSDFSIGDNCVRLVRSCLREKKGKISVPQTGAFGVAAGSCWATLES